MNIYVLKPNQPHRRAGLTRAGYRGPRLLETINGSSKDAQQNMPPRVVKAEPPQVKKKVEAGQELNDLDEKSIFRPPDSSSDEDEDGPRGADIIPTKFQRASEEPKPQSTSLRAGTRGSKASSRTANGIGSSCTKDGKLLRTELSPSSGNVPSGPKRKIQEHPVKYGAGMVDPFGRIRVKKAKVKSAYGSDQPRYGSSLSALAQKKNDTSKARNNDSARKSFQVPEFGSPLKSPDSDAEGSARKNTFKAVDTNFESPVTSDPEIGNGFKRPDKLEDTPTSTPGSRRKFIQRSISTSPLKEGDEEPDFRNPDLDDSQTDIDLPILESKSLRPRHRRLKNLVQPDQSAATQQPIFKKFDLGEELGKKVDSIIRENRFALPVPTPLFDEATFSTTQQARCPMCSQLVDPGELKAYGEMNTRQQERFCRAHQRKTAKEDWTSNGYPEIDWDTLNTRIAKHHSFMRQLINGTKSSHYRDILSETVKAGKDRTLLKMTSSLTPGYYGSRGLQAISESIMHDFTPLLKKRSVKDRLMAARGVTGFVQSVLVPEVAVLLIMEDMDVGVEEARTILTESVVAGELVNEEIRDVVRRRVEDSEGEEEEGEEEEEEDVEDGELSIL